MSGMYFYYLLDEKSSEIKTDLANPQDIERKIRQILSIFLI